MRHGVCGAYSSSASVLLFLSIAATAAAPALPSLVPYALSRVCVCVCLRQWMTRRWRRRERLDVREERQCVALLELRKEGGNARVIKLVVGKAMTPPRDARISNSGVVHMCVCVCVCACVCVCGGATYCSSLRTRLGSRSASATRPSGPMPTSLTLPRQILKSEHAHRAISGRAERTRTFAAWCFAAGHGQSQRRRPSPGRCASGWVYVQPPTRRVSAAKSHAPHIDHTGAPEALQRGVATEVRAQRLGAHRRHVVLGQTGQRVVGVNVRTAATLKRGLASRTRATRAPCCS
jgi:hypothetical protein